MHKMAPFSIVTAGFLMATMAADKALGTGDQTLGASLAALAAVRPSASIWLPRENPGSVSLPNVVVPMAVRWTAMSRTMTLPGETKLRNLESEKIQVVESGNIGHGPRVSALNWRVN